MPTDKEYTAPISPDPGNTLIPVRLTGGVRATGTDIFSLPITTEEKPEGASNAD